MLAVLQQIIQVIEVLFTGVVSFFSNVSMLLSKIPEFFIFAEAAYYTLPSVITPFIAFGLLISFLLFIIKLI